MFVSHKIYLVRPFSPPGLLCLGAIAPTLPSLSDVTDCYGLWLTHNAAKFVGKESAPKIIKEIIHRFLFALQLTLVSNTSLAILTSVPLNELLPLSSITRSLSFQARNLPFLQILPTVAFVFFFMTDSADSPVCLPTGLLVSISVFSF